MSNSKKIIFFILISMNFISAQKNTKFGIKGGLNFNKSLISYSSNNNSDAYVGYNLGVLLEIKLKNNLLLQPELNFTQLGATIYQKENLTQNTFRGTDFYFSDGNVGIKYASIPVNLKYKMNKYFTIYSGPQILVLLPEELNKIDVRHDVYTYKSNSGGYYEVKTDQNYQGSANSFISRDIDYGINIGSEVIVYKETFIDLRYYIGFNSVTYLNPDVKNRYLQLSLGYKF